VCSTSRYICGRLTAYGSPAVTSPFLDGLKLQVVIVNGQVPIAITDMHGTGEGGKMVEDMVRQTSNGGMDNHKEPIYLPIPEMMFVLACGPLQSVSCSG
jgi:hypothetical protein